MAFTSGTEVPDNYHLWSGIYALSAVVNRQVWLNMGLYTLYPNLYVVLLGPPGNGKSLAMDTSQVLVEDIGGITVSGDAQTKESLCQMMAKECVKDLELPTETVKITPLAMFATELSHLLGPNSGHMIDFLTTIYTKDKRYVTKTKNKGNDVIERPFVGLIACTTQEWITTYLKSDIIGGGFTRRVIFVNEPLGDSVDDKSKRRAFITVLPEQVRARENVINYANVLKTLKGEFTWHPDARAAYVHWYNTRDIPKDPDVSGYYKTKPNQVLKVAMIIALSEGTDLVLKKQHWDVSMALFDKTETTLTKVFQGIGRNELNAVANKATEYLFTCPMIAYKDGGVIKRAKIAPESKVRGYLYRDAPGRDCDDIIRHLLAVNRIFVYNIKHEKSGRDIRHLGLTESVVQSLDGTDSAI